MNALFVLNGSSGNRGCEAILLSTTALLREAFPGVRFVNSPMKDPRLATAAYLKADDMRHAPHPETASLAGLRWQIAKRLEGHRFNFERFVPWSDVVLSLGGDNYSMDYGSAHKYLSANDRVFEKGGKLVIWGASIGPFDKDPAIERRAAENLRRCHRVVVRETLTRDYLAGLGVGDNVELAADPAFSLTPDPVRLPAEIEAMFDKGAIGLNLSPLLARYRPSPETWVAEAAQWVEALLSASDRPVLLIPHVMEPGNDDQTFLAKVRGAVGATADRLALLDAQPLSSRNLKYVISRLAAFTGARTHATIAAIGSFVPTLSIGYSVKARGLNRDVFGSERWIVHHLDLDGSTLVAKVNELLTEGDAIRAHLKAFVPSYRMDASFVRRILTV